MTVDEQNAEVFSMTYKTYDPAHDEIVEDKVGNAITELRYLQQKTIALTNEVKLLKMQNANLDVQLKGFIQRSAQAHFDKRRAEELTFMKAA